MSFCNNFHFMRCSYKIFILSIFISSKWENMRINESSILIIEKLKLKLPRRKMEIVEIKLGSYFY